MEERPFDLTAFIEDVSYDVQDFHDPTKAIQYLDFLMSSAVTINCAHDRAAVAVFGDVSIQQIGKYEAAIQALNQKTESVSRASPNCADAIHNTSQVIQALILTRALRSKSSSPGSGFGSLLQVPQDP